MADTGADVLIETLMEWGVEVIFGLPGDGINGIMESLRQRQDKIRFIHVRHEESAAFMACAYAKYTRKLGVCLATSGPGGIHLLNGLYDAKMDNQPVLAITGMQFHDLVGTLGQQDVELDKLFVDVAPFNERVMSAEHVESLTNLACRQALSYRQVAHITFPVDLQDKEISKRERSKRNQPHHTSDVWAEPGFTPRESDMRAAADILNAGSKVVILAGAGALHATDELEQAAELLGAPIVKALLGKAAVPDSSPYTTGGIGLLGTKPSQTAMEACDTLFIVGTSFPYIEFYPKPGQARAVQIEIDPKKIALRYAVEAGLVGDTKRTLQQLIPLLRRKDDRSFLKKAQDGMRDWWKLMEQRGTRTEMPMKPQVLAWELGKQLSDNAIVSSDSGTITTWFARQIPAKRGQMFSCSGNLASMAPALPYSIAAQIAYPDRQCIAFIGDGGFSMLMGELATAVKYKLPIKIFIVKNDTLGQIKWEQMVFLGNPEYGVDLQPIDFAMFARACGAEGFAVRDPAECARIVGQALAHNGPVVVEAYVDPFEPPLPASVTLEQAAKLAESLVRGENDRGKIVETIFKDKIKELV